MPQFTSKFPLATPDIEPLIIPKSKHHLSISDLDRDALKVLTKLNDAGHTAYLVGGGVRDLYLGKTPKDYDISTDARPGQLRKIFRNSRTIGRRFRLVQVFFHDSKIIEVSTFRCRSEFDIKGEESVLPANNTFGNRADDAFRRDLTINALFFDIQNETIIDYTGGVADLDNKIIRIVGDPDRRITRDPVRMLRAIRHAARSSFTIEEETWRSIIRHRDKLSLCPISRIRDELMKDLHGGACAAWLRLTVDSGLFYSLFPCYQTVFENNDDKWELLSDIFSVVDRLHNEDQYIPDALLLGLILIPWAQRSFPTMTKMIQNKDLFALSRTIRKELEPILNPLNVKRAIKEQIAALLPRINLFDTYDKEKKWPTWLTKKSYFKESMQFYKIYREATGGQPVSILKLAAPPQKTASKSRSSSRRGGRGRTAAFAGKKQKGGVFGFQK